MKVLATKASRTDTKVTFTTNRLFDVLSYTADELSAGDQFILTFRKGQDNIPNCVYCPKRRKNTVRFTS